MYNCINALWVVDVTRPQVMWPVIGEILRIKWKNYARYGIWTTDHEAGVWSASLVTMSHRGLIGLTSILSYLGQSGSMYGWGETQALEPYHTSTPSRACGHHRWWWLVSIPVAIWPDDDNDDAKFLCGKLFGWSHGITFQEVGLRLRSVL